MKGAFGWVLVVAMVAACGGGDDDDGGGTGGKPGTGGSAGVGGSVSGSSGAGGRGGSAGSIDGGQTGDGGEAGDDGGTGGAAGEAGAGGAGGDDQTGGSSGVSGHGGAGHGGTGGTGAGIGGTPVGGAGIGGAGTGGTPVGGAGIGGAGIGGTPVGGAGIGGAGIGGTPVGGAGIGGAGTGGAGNAGMPGGGAGSGGTGGITTCPGPPDPACSCLKVTRDGDDTAAAAANGATPFRTVQAAIDFAGTGPNVPLKVCVAGFDTCSSATAYPSPRMKNGISVYGSYASSTWTRCGSKTTILTSAGSDTVRFGSDVTSETVLDSFQVAPSTSTLPTTLVSVNGAQNAVLANLELTTGAPLGIHVSSGARVRIEDSRVSFPRESTGIHVVASNARIARTVVEGAPNTTGASPANAVVLDAASGSRIEASTLSSTGGSDVVALRITGDASGIEIRGNTVLAANGSASTKAIALESCGGSTPIVADNPSIRATTTLRNAIAAVQATSCAARIENNPSIVSIAPVGAPDVTGVACSGACTIVGNVIRNEQPSFFPGDIGTVTGVSCSGCATIARNQITASGAGCMRSCATTAVGVTGSGLLEKNSISAESVTRATGVTLTGGTSSVRNNLVSASLLPAGPAPTFGGVAHALRVSAANATVHSNTLIATPSSLSQGFELGGLVLDFGGSTIRNNIVFGVRELGPGSDPLVFENNLAGAYFDEGTNQLLGATAINALTDMTVSGTIDGDPQFTNGFHLRSTSPCVGAGTSVGAPSDDLEGTSRTPPPDIGAYEWSAANDPCFGVCENGTCSAPGSSAQCSCNQGFQHPPNGPLVCEDVNECALNNGSCDPLTTCTNVPGSRTCGACPPGYSGTGETGCVPTLYCASNPCENGSCIEAHGTYACDCPPGITGHECQLVFDDLSPGNDTTCGVRSDGVLECWGRNTGRAAEPPAGTFVAVAAGTNFGCAVRSDATLACWGQNDYGQATPAAGTFQAVSTADSHACGLGTDGSVACWGNAANGRTTPPSGVFQTVSSQGNHSCALRANGTVECWGSNEFGQTSVPSGSYQAVAAGGYHTCALTLAGTPTCWGLFGYPAPSGTFGQIVTGGTYACALATSGTIACWGNTFNPAGSAVISGVPSGAFERLMGGPSHVCAVRADDSLACWGHDGAGKAHPPGGVVSALDAASDDACAITSARTIDCWGRSFLPPSGAFESVAVGQQFTCGVRDNGLIACSGGVSVTPPGGAFRELSAGTNMACGLRADGSVACFGPSAYQPEASSLFQQVSVGGTRACGVRTTTALECWGPSAPTFTGTYLRVGVGPTHACAVQTSGALECQGQDGDGESTPPPGAYVDVVVGDRHGCARRADGTIACWGRNSEGEATPPSGPFHSLAAGVSHTCAVRPDLRVECWGSLVR